MKSSFALALLFAGYAAAQSSTSTAADPTGTAGLTPCITDCTTQAASAAGCTGITDLECVCTNTEFQQAALECLQANCTPEEQQTALGLQQSTCAAVQPSGSATSSEPSATETDTETATETDTEASATATAPATGSATSRASTTSATSRASTSAAATSRASTASVAASSSAAASNAAGLPAVLDLAAAGTWAAVALGGAVVAQLAL